MLGFANKPRAAALSSVGAEDQRAWLQYRVEDWAVLTQAAAEGVAKCRQIPSRLGHVGQRESPLVRLVTGHLRWEAAQGLLLGSIALVQAEACSETWSHSLPYLAFFKMSMIFPKLTAASARILTLGEYRTARLVRALSLTSLCQAYSACSAFCSAVLERQPRSRTAS